MMRSRPLVMAVAGAMLLGVAGAGGAGVAEARLQFEQRRAQVTAAVADEQVQARFAFENVGEEAVTITGVTSSCGCTAGVAEKRTYEPGESGAVTATMAVGQRQGAYTARLVVRTDAAASPATLLTLTAALPELVAMEPRLLVWRASEPLAAKTVTVTLLAEGEAALAVEVESEAGAKWEAVLEPLARPDPAEAKREREQAEGEAEPAEPGAGPPQYRLTLTPPEQGAGEAGAGQVWLVLRFAEGQQRRFAVRTRVLPRGEQAE